MLLLGAVLLRRFVLMSLLLLTFHAKTDIYVATTAWQDFSHPDGTGIYLDLIREIFPNETLHFEVTPFAKSKQKFERKDVDIIVGVYPEDIKNKILPNWPIDQEAPVVAFYDSRFTQIKHVSDLQQLTVAWIRGYDFEHFVPHIQKPYLVDSVSTGFKLLTKDRVQAYVDYPYNLNEDRFPHVKGIEIMPHRKIYLAFQNNQRGQILAKQFDQKMAKLHSTGQLKTLFGDYYASAGFEKQAINRTPVALYTDENNLLNIEDVDRHNQHTALFKVTNQLQELLTNHYFTFKPLAPLSTAIKNHPDEIACVLNAVKTQERQQKYLISKPLTMYQGARLYSTKKLADAAYINIVTLMKNNPTLKLGLPKGRQFGDRIDALLAQLNKQQRVESSISEMRTIKQLQKGRFDLLIESPVVFAPFWQDQFPEQKFYKYQLFETPDYTYGHLVCSKNNASAQFINAVDVSLTKQYKTGLFYLAQLQLILNENLNEVARAYHKAFH